MEIPGWLTKKMPERKAVMPTVELIERSIWRMRMMTVWPSTSKAKIETFNIRSFKLSGLKKRGIQIRGDHCESQD